MGFAVPADHEVKPKEAKRKINTSTLLDEGGGETNKLWNMKVTVIAIVIGALGTVTKGMVLGLADL